MSVQAQRLVQARTGVNLPSVRARPRGDPYRAELISATTKRIPHRGMSTAKLAGDDLRRSSRFHHPAGRHGNKDDMAEIITSLSKEKPRENVAHVQLS